MGLRVRDWGSFSGGFGGADFGWGVQPKGCLAGGKKNLPGYLGSNLGFGLAVKRVPGSYFVSGFGDLGP